MADLTIACGCGQTLSAPPRWGGRRVRCGVCGREHAVPPPPPPPPPAWRRPRFFRRFAPAVPTPAREPLRSAPEPPPGLRPARRPPDPEEVAARRRRRIRRIVLLGVLLVLVVGGLLGGRIAWKAYRRSLYRGLEPTAVRPHAEFEALRERLDRLRALERDAAERPGSADAAAAYAAFARELAADLGEASVFPGERAYLCNNLAWLLLTTPFPELRDPEAALVFARAAVAGHNRENPAYLDTLAEALFQTGRFTAALEAAGEAVRRAPDHPGLRETYERIEDALLRR